MRTNLTSLLLFLLAVTPLDAQERQRIRPDREVAATLAPDSRHQYTIRLDEDMWVYGHVDQRTVDVVVTVLDPSGEEVEVFDAPARGPEPFQFETESAGEYVVQVTPFEEAEGDYAIVVLRVEPVATEPAARVGQLMAPYSGEDTPGGVVAVVEGGELVFLEAYGMANLAHGIPFEEDTKSNIGSVTKQFTAMGLLLLEQAGELSLDDDIREHIPELPDFGTPVTLRNLLNHTGGYREIYNFLPMAGYRGEDFIPRDAAIRIVQRQPALQTEPNTEMNYNNTGYILLATVIERVTDMTFPE